MKKCLFILAALLIGFAANVNAQNMAAGLNLNYGSGDSFTNYGIGAKFQYSVTEHWRAEAAFNYYLEKDNLSMYDLDVDVHYLFNIGDTGLKVYPLAGVTYYGSKVSVAGYSASDSKFGFNYGAGVEYPIGEMLTGNIEFKQLNVDPMTRNVLSIGVTYKF